MKISKKLKKILGDIIILHKCTKNHDHMLPCSWDMVHDACDCYFSFCAIFFPFTPLTVQKWKISTTKKGKNLWRYHHFIKNHDHILYCSWDMMHDTRNCYFSFWAIFCSFTPIRAQKNENFNKMKKNLEISSFYTTLSKIITICYTVPEMWRMTHAIAIFHFVLVFALLPP